MWIITAWQRMSPEVTVQGFKKCWISKAVDETDVDMLWNGSEEVDDGVSVRKWRHWLWRWTWWHWLVRV